MLKVTNTEVFGWEAAIRGMRNPKESWDKSDSGWHGTYVYATGMPIVDIGPNDLALMKKLVAAGTDHSKFMRMIHVQCDWESPLLSSSYLQKATMDLNYATLRNMYHARKAHKQDEWRTDFCNWVKTLPYSELITMTKEELLESIKEE